MNANQKWHLNHWYRAFGSVVSRKSHGWNAAPWVWVCPVALSCMSSLSLHCVIIQERQKKPLFLIFVTWYTWRGQVDDTSVSSSLPPFQWDPAAAKDDSFWRKNWKISAISFRPLLTCSSPIAALIGRYFLSCSTYHSGDRSKSGVSGALGGWSLSQLP